MMYYFVREVMTKEKELDPLLILQEIRKESNENGLFSKDGEEELIINGYYHVVNSTLNHIKRMAKYLGVQGYLSLSTACNINVMSVLVGDPEKVGNNYKQEIYFLYSDEDMKNPANERLLDNLFADQENKLKRISDTALDLYKTLREKDVLAVDILSSAKHFIEAVAKLDQKRYGASGSAENIDLHYQGKPFTYPLSTKDKQFISCCLEATDIPYNPEYYSWGLSGLATEIAESIIQCGNDKFYEEIKHSANEACDVLRRYRMGYLRIILRFVEDSFTEVIKEMIKLDLDYYRYDYRGVEVTFSRDSSGFVEFLYLADKIASLPEDTDDEPCF